MTHFQVSRSVSIQADPARVHALIDDFHEWTAWSPWKATNDITFDLTPTGEGTDVTWLMTGENKGMAAVVTKVFNMDKLVGKDFEKGLAQLKAAAEKPA